MSFTITKDHKVIENQPHSNAETIIATKVKIINLNITHITYIFPGNTENLVQSCAKHWPFLVCLKFVKPANVWKSTWARLFANIWRKFKFRETFPYLFQL